MEISKLGKQLYCQFQKRFPAQLLLKMKLSFIIVMISCMQAIAHPTYSQSITFSGRNVSLQSVFASIEKQTGFSFFFNFALIKDAKLVTLDLKDVPLEDALHEVLKGQGLDFYRTGKTIFIVKKVQSGEINPSNSSSPATQVIDIKGRVTDQQGGALAGATVSVKYGNKATLTDDKGMFELKGVLAGSILEITYLGYQRREIRVEGGDIRVEMTILNNKLDEVQVIAYGNTTERFSTGNVSTVKGEDIEKQPVNNPLLAIEGRVPGLFITQSRGFAGEAPTIRVEGQNSISSGNEPLYVVDGVPFVSQLLSTGLNSATIGSTGSANSGSAAGSPLSYINPSDIESITVLKDADATAIYGSRAANGAILIVTRKGKAGQTRINLNGQTGWGHVGNKLHLLNTQQYLQMRHEAKSNDGVAVLTTDYDINGTWDSTRHTDWQNKLIGGTSQYTDAEGSISGGSGNTQFLIGPGYHRETTVYPGNFSDQKGSLHFNIDNHSADRKFDIQLFVNYLVDYNQLPTGNDLTLQAMTLAPDAPNLYNADGSLNWMPASSGTSSWINPLSYLYNRYKDKANNLISNTALSYKLLPSLEIRASLGYTNFQSKESITATLASKAPETRLNSTRVANYAYNSINSWIIEPQLSYAHSLFGDDKLEALLGTTIQQNNSSGQQFSGQGYNSDFVMDDIKSAATVTVLSSVASAYKYNALFARINYNVKNRYLLNLTARRDGSSRFGPGNQFANFGAIGAAWIFTQEDFINRKLSILSFGKLKGSYGTTGSDQIGDYKFLPLYSPTSGIGVPYQNLPSLSTTGLPNPNLKWEETKKLNVGLDLGFLKDRILITANYAINRSSNQLVAYTLPINSGGNFIFKNLGATVQNSSWEFSINTVNVTGKKFNWNTSFNLTIPRNRLTFFPDLATSSLGNTLAIGQSVSLVRAFTYMGVDPTTGIYDFKDATGKTTSAPSFTTDRTSFINPDPKIYGGIENSFSYKGISLDIFFQYVSRRGTDYLFGANNPAGYFNTNEPTRVLSRWQKPGDVSKQERYSSNTSLFTALGSAIGSNAAYVNASYIRLKNVSLSWQLPSNWREKAGLKNARIYLQGQNLFNITNYVGLDPETLSSAVLPPLRVITIGAQIQF
jgi:TonB-linked SusC/RagA family outer membrane protein